MVRACATGCVVDTLQEDRQTEGLGRTDHRPRHPNDPLRSPRRRRTHPRPHGQRRCRKLHCNPLLFQAITSRPNRVLVRMGQQLIAIVAEGTRGRSYITPHERDAAAAECDEPAWKPQGRNPEKLTGGTVFVYGLDEWWKLFTPRQLSALTTFSDLLPEVAEKAKADAVDAVRR